ncbi:MAG: UDP-N-acetylmuramoylalanine--D-glutamate ligase [Fusobacteria bacterium]|nr:MAG: UDP-N-acetylmuramoylalanine--D-glutamate ligase [Fusobacteriota bacterium]KAF0229943.1 MAG: UDP-N-acetylmuramoylalanine--D-glutamate [Fusobacteriota bacterium]
MNLNGKKILILGKGKTGTSTAEFLLKQKSLVVLVDEVDDGPFINIDPLDFEMIIHSPGISRQHPFLLKCDELGIKVTNEIELAYNYVTKPIIGVTGTNGKTTIVNLIDYILKTCNIKSSLVGNVGNPFITAVNDKIEVYVLELSSYQLETIDNFRPHIAIISNLTPDHLERHKTMENYLSIKTNIYRNMNKKDFLILNYDDENLKNLDTRNIETFYYSLSSRVKGIYLKDDEIVLNIHEPVNIMKIDDLKIIGRHNIENAMASILAAYLYGCTIECIVKGAKNFKGVEHRLEFVNKINGVAYFNDSKATNPEASIIGIKAFAKKNVYVIIGGSEKEVSYLELCKTIVDYNVYAILQGNTRHEVAKLLDELKYSRYIKLENLLEAVNFAKSSAKNGEVVLLSPACASFDQFDNFEHRGEVFKEYVNKK